MHIVVRVDNTKFRFYRAFRIGESTRGIKGKTIYGLKLFIFRQNGVLFIISKLDKGEDRHVKPKSLVFVLIKALLI